MANFNPQIQNQDPPSYFGLSKPIDAYEGDKSAGILLSGAGHALTSAIQGADTVVKSVIDDSLNTSINTGRDAYTSVLDEQKANTTGRPVTDAARPLGQPLDVLPEGSSGVPAQVATGLRTIGNLQNASATSGDRLTETFYYGRLNAIAKSLRSEWPGYRDYIDQKISQMTGGNPANDYIRSIVSEINRSQTATNTESQKVTSFIQSNMNLPNAPLIMTQWKNGQRTSDEVYNWAAPYLKQKNDLEMYNLTHTTRSNVESEDSSAALKAVTEHTASSVTGYLNGLTILSNAGTPEKLNDFITNVASGKETASQKQLDDVLTRMVAERNSLVANEKAVFNQPNPKTGLSITQTINDPDKLDKAITSQVKVLDDQIEYLKNKDFSPMFANKRFAEAQQDKVGKDILSRKDIGISMATTSWINKNAGPNFAKDFFTVQVKDGAKLGKGYSDFITDEKKNMLSQPDKDIRVTGDNNGAWSGKPLRADSGIPYTLAQSLTNTNEMVDNMNTKTPGSVTPELHANMNKELTDTVKVIADPQASDAVKVRAARAYFDPSNRGVISRFAPDTYDTNGRPIPGQMAIFSKMTTPEITTEIKRLSGQDPTIWTNYKDWVESTFGRELFANKIRETQDLKSNPFVRVKYDSDMHQFSIDVSPRSQNVMDERGMSFPQYIQQMQRNISFINQGLRTVGNVAKAENGDPDAYVLGLLRQNGFHPDGGTVPDQMTRAVIESKQPAKTSPSATDPFKTKTPNKTSERIVPGSVYGYVTPDRPLSINPQQ